MPEIIKTVFDDDNPEGDGEDGNSGASEEVEQDPFDWSALEGFGVWGGEMPEDAAFSPEAEPSTEGGESEGVKEFERYAAEAIGEDGGDEDKAEMEQEREWYRREMEYEAKHSGISHHEKMPETEEEAFRIYLELGSNKNNAVRGLMQADEEGIERIKRGVGRMEETLESLPEEIRYDKRMQVSGEIKNVEVEFVRQHDPETMTDEAVEDVCECIVDATKSGDMVYRQFRIIRDGIQAAAIGRNPKAIRAFYDFSKELLGTPEDDVPGSKYQKKSSLVRSYAVLHGLSERSIEGFRNNVFPMIDAADPEVECLMEASNSFGTVPGDFGISDFTIHSLVSEVNPRNVRDLMQVYREIPTSDYKRFEMNRKDALALMGALWQGRDFIHDERPGVHELLEAMVKFYDSKDDPEEHARAEERLRVIVADRRDPMKAYAGFDGELCLDVENYDKQLSGSRDAGSRTPVSYEGMTAIEVLRRLEENTRQISLEKPRTGDEELDGLIEKLEVIERNDGEIAVEFDEVAAIVKRANEILASCQGEVGLKPSMIKALSYIERMATAAMRGISKKDYSELPFDPGFKEIVRFNELTASGRKYSEEGFEQFWSGFVSGFSKTWEDNPSEGYGILSQRVTGRLGELAQQYKAERRPRYMTDSLWSGNLSHELIGLVDSRR